MGALAATGDDALRWLGSGEKSHFEVRDTRKAVNFVYQRLGMASPLRERRVVAALRGATAADRSADEYSQSYRDKLWHRQRDYVVWCHRHGHDPLTGSPGQVAEFLRSLYPEYSHAEVELANVAVSMYLENHGRAGTSHHPAATAAVAECRARHAALDGDERKPLTRNHLEFHDKIQEQWREWCDGESIEWRKAASEDALRYLRGLEHQRTAASRVFILSKLYQGLEDPFSSEEVLAWKKQHRQALKDGTLPEGPPKRRGRDVIEDIWAVQAAKREEEPVPVGLTREEVDAVQDDVGDRYAERTLFHYTGSFARFERWFGERGIAIEEVEGRHVVVYLDELSPGVRVSTLYGVTSALLMAFDELGIDPNPVLDRSVEHYLKRLKRSRREAPSQMNAFRDSHYQKIVKYENQVLSGEVTKRAELDAAVDLVIFGMMFDGMLRGIEAAAACWKHLSRMADGSGRLLIPFSKTDRFGETDLAFVSPRTMESLERLREVRSCQGLLKPGDDRILRLGAKGISRRVQAACEAAGLEGRFGTHSMRIGMAQELALAGFGLTMIMQAGRWGSPEMPAYYIRELRVPETAVAELHRMWEDGRRRVEQKELGADYLSLYHAVRYGDVRYPGPRAPSDDPLSAS